jgi:hypothetical protein
MTIGPPCDSARLADGRINSAVPASRSAAAERLCERLVVKREFMASRVSVCASSARCIDNVLDMNP